jgi:hypothetical protein
MGAFRAPIGDDRPLGQTHRKVAVLKPSLVTLAATAVLVPAVSASAHPQAALTASATAIPSPFLPQPPFGPPREIVLFGRIKSLAPAGSGFQIRVDPAEFLSGETANQAAIEDKVIPPGGVVPNDHYIRDEGHRLLTYRVPATAHVTVVTNRGTRGIRATAITVAELAQIVKGKKPKHRALFEPKNGFWIRVANDSVRSLDQQYSP